MNAEPLTRYDTKTIGLHWLTAGLVILLWCSGQTIDWFPRGTVRVSVRSLHIVIGALLVLIYLYRLWWRNSAGLKLPPANDNALQQLLTSLVHVGLYVLLFVTLAVGLANAWVRGDSLFGWFRIPAFDPGNKELRKMVEGWHEVAANALFILAGVHAAAALVHHYVLKDSVLRRMLRHRGT